MKNSYKKLYEKQYEKRGSLPLSNVIRFIVAFYNETNQKRTKLCYFARKTENEIFEIKNLRYELIYD